jgi:hypothetical protein
MRVTCPAHLIPGPYHPLGTTGTVPRAYHIFRAYEGTEGRKIKMAKYKNVIQNKIQDFKNNFLNQNSTLSLPVKWEVCDKSTFLSLYLAKGAVSV